MAQAAAVLERLYEILRYISSVYKAPASGKHVISAVRILCIRFDTCAKKSNGYYRITHSSLPLREACRVFRDVTIGNVKQSESGIGAAICDCLVLRQHFFWRQNTAPTFDTSEGVFRRMPKRQKISQRRKTKRLRSRVIKRHA
jgi:hypothetical protein